MVFHFHVWGFASILTFNVSRAKGRESWLNINVVTEQLLLVDSAEPLALPHQGCAD